MATLGDVLRRFRAHGVPGAPAVAVAAVPADRATAIAAEVAPVLEALDQAQRVAAAVRASAADEAARRRARAVTRAQQVIEEARSAMSRVRTEEMALGLARVGTTRAGVLAAAHTEAQRVGLVAADRLPEMTERVVGVVLAMLGPSDSGRPQRP